jgi:hypothetical protein
VVHSPTHGRQLTLSIASGSESAFEKYAAEEILGIREGCNHNYVPGAGKEDIPRILLTYIVVSLLAIFWTSSFLTAENARILTFFSSFHYLVPEANCHQVSHTQCCWTRGWQPRCSTWHDGRVTTRHGKRDILH